MTWDELGGNAVIEGDTATFTETDIEAEGGRRFYRVREL